MIETLTTSQAAHYLLQDENAAWSYAGAHAIVEHLEQMEEDCGGEPIEFDRVAIRCDFSEHSSLQDWAAGYFGEGKSLNDLRLAAGIEADTPSDEIDDKIREYISDHGQLIEFDGGIIVSSF